MRIRSIRPEAYRDLDLARVPPELRWTFAGLWVMADDDGYLPDDPRVVKADLYALDDLTIADVDKQLEQLSDVRDEAGNSVLLCRYTAPGSGRRLMHIPGTRVEGNPFRQTPQKHVPSALPTCPVDHYVTGQGALFDPHSTDTGLVLAGEERRGEEGRGDGVRDQSRTTTRGTRLPDTWQPGPDYVAWARQSCPFVDLRFETDKFRDYWHSRAGNGARKRDWDLTWRNWMRKAQEDATERRRRNGDDGGPADSRPAFSY